MKRLIRYWVVHLDTITANWVVPTYIWRLIDRDRFAEARAALDKQAQYWGNHEPEIFRARSLIDFMDETQEIDNANKD